MQSAAIRITISWGPNGYTGESVVAMGFSRQKLESYFSSVDDAGTVYHPYSAPREHFTLYRCRGPKQPDERDLAHAEELGLMSSPPHNGLFHSIMNRSNSGRTRSTFSNSST